MSGREAHLSSDEIDGLLGGAVMPEDVRAHLAECADCAGTMNRNLVGQKVLESIRGTAEAGSGRCPAPETWWEIAAGVRGSTEALLEHAGGCEKCGGELRAALEANASGDADDGLPPLRLDAAPARSVLSERLAANASQGSPLRVVPARRSPGNLRMKYISAAIAAMLVLAAGTAFLLFRSPSAATLTARAYEEKRTVEFRLPGAGYAPIRLERSGGAGRVNGTIPLLEAEGKEAKELSSHPDSPILLQQLARIELLNWNYTSAIRRLTRALELQSGNQEAPYDLALAYFERAQTEDRASDYGAAVEVLGKILAKQPDDPVALFNRAIVLEKLMMYREADADWEHFLKREPKGGWADEARTRLAEIQQKLKARLEPRKPCAQMTASLVVKWSRNGELERNLDQWEDGWACLRERAIVDWIPALGAPINLAAVRAADAAFRKTTGDTWFADLLKGSSVPEFSRAAAALAEAVAANRMVDAGRAEATARRARDGFDQIGNAAGAAQAAVEYDYAIRRAQTPGECRPVLESLERKLQGHSWVWTSLQQRLETYACRSMAGERGAAKRIAQETVSLTEQPTHAGMHLRAISYLAESERMTAEYADAWQHGTEGLRAFWSGHAAPVWAYQLYYHLAMAAMDTGRPRLALHLHRETLAEIQLAGRPSMEAMEWFDYGRAALLADATTEARHAFSTAFSLFRALPGDRGIKAMLADSEVFLAELDNREGKPGQALARLEKVRSEMSAGNTFIMQTLFLRAVAESDKLLGKRAKAEPDLVAVIDSAEHSLASLRNFGQQERWARENGDAYRQFADLLAAEKRQPERALDAWERYRGAAFHSLQSEMPPLALPSFSRLGIGQALIYAALEDRLLIWRIRDGALSLHTISVPRQELELLSRRLYLLCSDPDSSLAEIDSVARQLSVFLLTPVEAELALTEPLWVELDEALAGVPFQVLITKSGEMLGVKCSVAVFPGLRYIEQSSPARPFHAKDSLLAVGVSTGPGLTPLPGASLEARQAAARFQGGRAWVDGEATLENIERELPRVSVFHFAGHAQSTANQAALLLPGRTAMARLDAETVAALDLKQCRLAVISACSAEAPEFFGESRPFGLATALLRAGASTVLATRWNLDSETGLRYMDAFYTRLLAGDTVAGASLAAAGRIREDQGTAHPYYWAAYQLFGRA